MSSWSSPSARSFVGFAHTAFLALLVFSELVPSVCLGNVVPVQAMAAKDRGMLPAAVSTANSSSLWGTGTCNSLLPGGGSVAPPGNVDTAWVTLEQEAISKVEEFYGQNSDPSHVYAWVYARGMTRAYMFATLVKAINDVHNGSYTADELAWVNAFAEVVRYGREWVAIDALNRLNTFNTSPAATSAVANNIVQLLFGVIGLPWRNDPKVPNGQDFLQQSQTALWGPPTVTNDAGNNIQNYPLGNAESATALHEMSEAIAFLNAVGDTQIRAPGGTDSALKTAMAGIEQSFGNVSAGDMAEAISSVKDVASIASSGENENEGSAIFTALANSVYVLTADVDAGVTLTAAESTAFTALNASSLFSALNDSSQFSELMNDFAAITQHSLPVGLATGNDPDCRTINHIGNASGLSPDATFNVLYYPNSTTSSYSYSTQVLGGNAAGTVGSSTGIPSDTVNDPSVMDWTYARDLGPGAPRIGANWPISEISYGVPGDTDFGWDQRAPSTFFSWAGYWYISFNGSQPNTTYNTTPFHIYVDGAHTVHPTDSEVASAIAAADPFDFPTAACDANYPYGAREDPALSPHDQTMDGSGHLVATNWPCLDWNWKTHLGTMLIVRGDQWDNNLALLPNYQVIFDILVKGDIADWTPVFVGHGGKGPGQPSDCEFAADDGVATAGVCLGWEEAAPFAGDVVESNQLWQRQQNDVCANDPATCQLGGASYGWTAPYPAGDTGECQAISPAAGMFVIQFVGEPNNCNTVPTSASFKVTPSIHYRDIYDNLWVAWRVPPTIGTSNFLNIQAAQLQTGNAGMLLDCDSNLKNAICLIGSGTHWSSEFHPGDSVMLVDPTNPQINTGGHLSMMRKIDSIQDDTHMFLSSSIECLSGADGNDCLFYNTAGYTSFMNPGDGNAGDGVGMYSWCTTSDCQSGSQTFQFNIYKMTEQNPGPNCATWNYTTTEHPPTSGCYYSNAIQFRTQTYPAQGLNSWWNASLPAPPATPAARPTVDAPSALEPWLDQPVITQQPKSVEVSAGASPSFTATATGSPTPTVQWQRSIDSGSTWNNISGASTTTYSLNSVTSGQNGWAFRAVFTNTNGSRTSPTATLGITAAPQLTLSPTPLQGLKLGDPITLTSAATGAPQPAADWQFSSDGGATWKGLGGVGPTISLMQGPSPSPPLLVRVEYINSVGSVTSLPVAIVADDIFSGSFEQIAGP